MRFERLVVLATVLTFCLIMLGAYVRLSDAGLGCPDWPGCYGQLSPHHAASEIAQAVESQGGAHGPVSAPKAWKEMVHRYIASFLGLMLIAIAIQAWRRRLELQQSPWLAIALVGVVCLQGAFGAWTVTKLLRPAIVTGHLIGGMTVLALLVWLCLRQKVWASVGMGQERAETSKNLVEPRKGLRGLAHLGLIVVVMQIVLGGWVSTNYAAVVCHDFPMCQGQWWPSMEFNHAFHVVRELGETPDGQLLEIPSLTAIHMMHRLGALVVCGVLVSLIVALWRHALYRKLALAVAGALGLQVLLGVGNVLLSLPLWLAVLHNGGAALLLATLILVNYQVVRSASSA